MSADLPTLLIVDDEETIRESFADYFEDHAWQVLTAKTGEEALEILAQNDQEGRKIDSAIIDLRLPGMNGHTLIDKLRRAYPHIACVICTGSLDALPPKKTSSSPHISQEVFTKPVTNLAHLEDILRRHLTARAPHRASS